MAGNCTAKKNLDKKAFEYYQKYVERVTKILEKMFEEVNADSNAGK